MSDISFRFRSQVLGEDRRNVARECARLRAIRRDQPQHPAERATFAAPRYFFAFDLNGLLYMKV
jgi:hypothetical protein